MDELDAMFRGAAMAVALLFGATFWRARPKSAVSWMASCFATGVIAYLVWTHPVSLTWLWSRPANPSWPRFATLALAVLALPTPFFFWALARLIFDDGFRLRAFHFMWFAIIEGAGLANVLTWNAAEPWLRQLLGLGFPLPSLTLVGHALWVIGRGRAADLVESRVRLRLILVCAGIATALLLLAAILYAPPAQWTPALKLGEAAGIMLLSLTCAVLLTRVDRDLLPTELPSARATLSPVGTQAIPAADPDAEVLARLESVMVREEVWREQGLTIGALATRLVIPEYRLRRLINQRLGYRNFPAFVNEYRLTAAATRLADPAQARLPVLTIALELGWGSIGPFNRAFRVRFGMTPSDYRRERLSATAAMEQCRGGS